MTNIQHLRPTTMAYDEILAKRMAAMLDEKGIAYEAKKMMGGYCLMVDDKMCVGIFKNELMARIDPDDVLELIQYKGVRQMEMAGRTMQGYVLVDPKILKTKEQLKYWIQLCLDFNPKAKSSKKK